MSRRYLTEQQIHKLLAASQCSESKGEEFGTDSDEVYIPCNDDTSSDSDKPLSNENEPNEIESIDEIPSMSLERSGTKNQRKLYVIQHIIFLFCFVTHLIHLQFFISFESK